LADKKNGLSGLLLGEGNLKNQGRAKNKTIVSKKIKIYCILFFLIYFALICVKKLPERPPRAAAEHPEKC